MNKLIFVILLMFCLCACSEDVAETESSEVFVETVEVEYNDEPLGKYQTYADGIDFIENTFTHERSEEIHAAIDEYQKEYSYEKWSERPPVLWYLIKKLELTKDDIIKYYEVHKWELTDEMLNNLFIEDENEAKTALKAKGS